MLPFFPLVTGVDPHHRSFLPLRLRCLLSVIRNRRRLAADTDILYVQSPELALPFTVRSALPYVLHLHGSTNPAANARYALFRRGPFVRSYAALMARVVRASVTTIVVEKDGLAYCEGIARDSGPACLMIEPCFDETVFKPADRVTQRRALGIPEDDKVVIFVGRLESGKGVAALLEAFRELTQRLDTVRLLIVGQGSQREALERQVANGTLAERVTMLGWLQADLVARYLAAADVFVLPSEAEGLPISLIEALACGVPAVATRVGGIPDLITNGINGLLVSSGVHDELVEGLERALSQSWRPSDMTSSVAGFTGAAIAGRVQAALGDALERARS